MRILLFLFILLGSLSSCSKIHIFGKKDGFSKVMKSTDYDYKLKMAEKYYIKKDYNHAQQLYDDLFRVMKGSDHFEDIYYKYAYCSFYLKDYQSAENLFKGFVEAFPNSPKAEEMEYMRAYSFYKESPKAELDQTNTTKAIGFLQAFVSMHPNSDRVKEAQQLIEQGRSKLEKKDFENALLYYDLEFYRASALEFNQLMNSFPESARSDEYKLYIIKANFKYAGVSTEEKKYARLQQVITDCNDFIDRFPDSKLKKDAEGYLDIAKNSIKSYKNE
ncbi:MAG TPA: outer membrane protein assembly factor BamD [Puia sp.]|nr:outer membrane protein assembly factor BamD [Puia sp.]